MIWHSRAEKSASAVVILGFVRTAIYQELSACGRIAQPVLKAVLGQQVNAVLVLEVQGKLEPQ